MSNLMSRPGEANDAKVKRSASVPKAGMPAGNSLRVRFSICSACFGFIRPVVRFLSKSSSVMPSIRSIGSSTLPLDLDIFCPSASRIRPCTYTSLNGIFPVMCFVIITMRATQKKMMSKPVTSTVDGRYFSRNRFCLSLASSPVQSSVENGHSAEENQVSSTSSSRFKGKLIPFLLAISFASASSCATTVCNSPF